MLRDPGTFSRQGFLALIRICWQHRLTGQAEFVIPRTFSPEFELIVAGLRLSADLQQRQARSNAVLAFGGSVLVGLLLNEIRKAA